MNEFNESNGSMLCVFFNGIAVICFDFDLFFEGMQDFVLLSYFFIFSILLLDINTLCFKKKKGLETTIPRNTTYNPFIHLFLLVLVLVCFSSLFLIWMVRLLMIIFFLLLQK